MVGKDYYTQEQLAEIIQYAAQRNIEVIPELDIPGHTVAILAAYPELGCTHTDTLPKIVGKTTDLMLWRIMRKCMLSIRISSKKYLPCSHPIIYI